MVKYRISYITQHQIVLTIKRVDPSRNTDILRRLQRECLPLDSLYSTKKGFWWISYINKTPIGFAAMVPSSQWDNTGYLCRAGVIELFQGRGIQKKLINARAQYARSLRWTHLISDTHRNPASANSLIHCGFKMYEPQYPWGARETLYWIKKL